MLACCLLCSGSSGSRWTTSKRCCMRCVFSDVYGLFSTFFFYRRPFAQSLCCGEAAGEPMTCELSQLKPAHRASEFRRVFNYIHILNSSIETNDKDATRRETIHVFCNKMWRCVVALPADALALLTAPAVASRSRFVCRTRWVANGPLAHLWERARLFRNSCIRASSVLIVATASRVESAKYVSCWQSQQQPMSMHTYWRYGHIFSAQIVSDCSYNSLLQAFVFDWFVPWYFVSVYERFSVFYFLDAAFVADGNDAP